MFGGDWFVFPLPLSPSTLKRGFRMEGREANIELVHRDVLRVISRRGSLVVVCGGVLSREWEDTYRAFLDGWLERGDGEGALTEEEVNVVNRLLEYVPNEGGGGNGGEQDAFNAVDAGRAINGRWEDRRFIRSE